MNFSVLFSFLLICLFAFKSNAEFSIAELNAEDHDIYMQTLVSCGQYKQRDLNSFVITDQEKQVLVGTYQDIDGTIDMLTESKDLRWALGEFKKSKYLGLRLHKFLNSDGFMFALKNCFHQNERQEFNYVISLLILDASVKGLVLGTAILAPIKFLTFISKYYWGYSLIMIFNFSIGYNLAEVITNLFKPTKQEILKKNLDDLLLELKNNYRNKP